nr:hypothetical protein [Arthrobacter sp. SF27]
MSTRRGENLEHAGADDDGVEPQEDSDQRDGHGHGLGEAEQEHPAEDEQQDNRHGDGMAADHLGRVGVFEQVDRRVGRRQRDGDDPRGGDEAQQDQHKDLAPPERQQVLEHRHRTLPVRARLRHPAVHREHAQQRQRDDQQRGQRREHAGGQRGDRRQVGQRGEVVHAGQAHDLPPRLLSAVGFRTRRPDRLDNVRGQPA